MRSLLASSDVAARPLGRLAALPAASRDMVEMMACLGSRLTWWSGTWRPRSGTVAETGAHDAVRFRHDRIREAILAKLDTQQRRSLQLALARRLAATPELVAVAAQQYLPVIEAITRRGGAQSRAGAAAARCRASLDQRAGIARVGNPQRAGADRTYATHRIC